MEIARTFGVSDLIIGLTVIAIGTSLPELAASVVAAKKREHNIALGNVIGSNLFNTMAVVGIADVIDPSVVDPALLNRDIAVTAILTASLFVFGTGLVVSGGSTAGREGVCCPPTSFTAAFYSPRRFLPKPVILATILDSCE